jgi:uncharacterized protein YfiM (DUF2279 family)
MYLQKLQFRCSDKCLILSLVLILFFSTGVALSANQDTVLIEKQADTSAVNKKRLAPLLATAGTLYAGSVVGLYYLWYKDYPQSSFHFFNDNDEWLQMDKAGHTTASYYIGLIGYSSLRWAGVSEKKSTWYGGMTGLVYLTTVEIMDGFSEQWGASVGDMIANTTGTALFISQQLAWHEQKFVMKWSYHSSPYAQYNPDLLGSTPLQSMLKDYNGQTYWLSANISSLGLQHTRFPKWINLAAGYGAEGMTGASSNPSEVNGVPVPYSKRYRQFYIAPDIDLSRIPVKSKTLKLILKTVGFIKIPMPALEFNKNGVKFHPLYF